MILVFSLALLDFSKYTAIPPVNRDSFTSIPILGALLFILHWLVSPLYFYLLLIYLLIENFNEYKNSNYTGVDVLIAQLCQTLCNLMDCSPPGSSVHGIFQVRILEWVTISFFRESSQSRDQTWVSCIALRFVQSEPPGNTGFSQVVLMVKNTPVNARDIRDTGLIPGSGRSPRGGHGNPLQDPCPENPTDTGAW